MVVFVRIMGKLARCSVMLFIEDYWNYPTYISSYLTSQEAIVIKMRLLEERHVERSSG